MRYVQSISDRTSPLSVPTHSSVPRPADLSASTQRLNTLLKKNNVKKSNQTDTIKNSEGCNPAILPASGSPPFSGANVA